MKHTIVPCRLSVAISVLRSTISVLRSILVSVSVVGGGISIAATVGDVFDSASFHRGYHRSRGRGYSRRKGRDTMAAAVSGILVVQGRCYHPCSGRWHINGWREQSTASSLHKKHHRCKIGAAVANRRRRCKLASPLLTKRKILSDRQEYPLQLLSQHTTPTWEKTVNLPGPCLTVISSFAAKFSPARWPQLSQTCNAEKANLRGYEACWAVASAGYIICTTPLSMTAHALTLTGNW